MSLQPVIYTCFIKYTLMQRDLKETEVFSTFRIVSKS